MKTYKIYKLVLIAMMFLVQSTYGQSKEYTIAGKVVDKGYKTFIEAASVVILDLKKSTIIAKTKTQSDGEFSISFKKGKYHISFSIDQYESIVLPIKDLKFENNQLNLGNVELQSLASIELEEVVVVAKDYRVESSRGKKTFHIGKNLKEVAGSMSNLLSYIPSVSVDIDGQLQLRGRKPIIMINGRRSNLSKSEALQMLPSDMVKSIEVIRNPSAREGETEPIINIITDKRKRKLIGGVNGAAGVPSTLKGGMHLATNREKFNGYGLYGFKKENNIGSDRTELLQVTNNNLDYSETENSSNSVSKTNHFGETQYEFIPNKRSELVGSLSVFSDENRIRYSGERTVQANSVVNDVINQFSDNSSRTFTFLNQMEYEVKLNEGKDQFKAEIEYEYESKRKGEFFSEEALTQTGMTTTESNDRYKSQELELQTRYDKTLKNNGYFTIGYRLDRNIFDQDQTFETSLSGSSILENDIRFTQYDHTLTTDFSKEYEKFYYSIGLRLRNTKRTLDNRTTSTSTTRNFFNALPIIIMTYQSGEDSEINLNYYSLLRQPRLSFLNEFNTSIDLQQIRIGNPDLDPQSTHNIELEYYKEYEKSTLTTTLFTYFARDIIQYVSTFDDVNNLTISRPENIGKANTYGIDFSYTLNSPRWLNLILKFNGKYGTFTDDSIDINEFYSLNSSITNIFRFKSYRFELSWFYFSPRRINFQVEEATNQYFKLGVSKRVFKSKGSLVFSVLDPFNSGRRIQTVDGAGFNYRSEVNPNQRRVFLSLLLRFSSKSKFRKTDKKIKEKGILK